MQPEPDTSAQLGTFEPPLAAAVAEILRRQGIAAGVEPPGHGESEVRVPAARRDEALAVLAGRMEEIQELVRQTLDGRTLPVVEPPDEDTEGEPAIVMERLRRMGLGIAVVLAPLLIITLAGRQLPMGYALALFVFGLVAVVYWRNRADDDR